MLNQNYKHMKQVKLTIKGDIIALDYCSTTMYDEDNDFYSCYYLCCGWSKLDEMYIDGNEEENVIKKKGKYVKTKEFFHNLFKADGDHPLPVECHTRTYYNQEISYMIELEDDEEFDIKKVQLVKSDYECDEFPYWIIADHILYNGKEICTDETMDYCPEEKMHDTFIIDSLYEC